MMKKRRQAPEVAQQSVSSEWHLHAINKAWNFNPSFVHHADQTLDNRRFLLSSFVFFLLTLYRAVKETSVADVHLYMKCKHYHIESRQCWEQ